MQYPQITIRIGASHDEVTVDGQTFDRSRMTRSQRNKFRRIVVGAFRKVAEHD